MDNAALCPFLDDADWLQRYCKLPLHTGVGTVRQHGDPNSQFAQMARRVRQANGNPEPAPAEFAADFFVPSSGNCRIFLRWAGESELSRNFGEGMTVTGDSAEGPFRLEVPRYYVEVASDGRERPGWAVASIINGMATVSYGEPRPIAKVTALINNFDFDHGNVGEDGNDEHGPILRVEAAGKTVDFAWRSQRVQLRRLVDAGLMGTTAFVTFAFNAWDGACEQELATFAHNVASLCSYVVA
jgi:hypothetical protein